ncbi:MAG: hypothetical protein WCI23_07205 [Chlorobiaceae bacterium]
MFRDNLQVDPKVTDGEKHSAMLLSLLGAPLALGAVASIVIGGLGLGAAALAAPLAGKFFKKVVSDQDEELTL